MNTPIDTTLDTLLATKYESEIVEFKEAKNNFSFDELGKYFSALSNEANLHNEECAWLVFGVEDKEHSIVGTNYRNNAKSLHGLKEEIGRQTSENLTFIEIYECFRKNADGEEKRILLFQIPAAPKGIPIAFKRIHYGRDAESVVGLSVEKFERIRAENPQNDWSAEVIPNATMDHLSKDAIELARKMYAEKNPRLADDIARWDDETFLNNARLTREGKITNTTILLLGKREAEDLILPALSQITWILKDRDGVVKDYEHFFCPLIISAEKIQEKIRNLTYRYMTGDSIFPKETLQYDPYIIREALNNCIAHQDYAKAGRITVQEHEDDYLIFCNCGDFIPGSIENVLKAEYSASNYRNPFLATAMVNLNMIDTVGSGILKMFLAQKKRCFPLPDYDFSNHEVRMKLYGKVLDINYTKRLLNEDLSLSEVFALDKQQKKMYAQGGGNAERNQVSEDNISKNNNLLGNLPNKLPNNCPIIAQKTYLAIVENPAATIQQLCALLGLSERTIKSHQSLLKKTGLIEYIGSRKNGYWKIN
ncbi:MAG: putative DNA binding domain-containing protein [Treponema sp.]|uniref:RNA-binding domain-containing protein n=1 Tax=Treponema sp. TaxID=166 RepID=UPI0025D8BDDE|nr:RNA-binding domain-containing protein [Treponema sp.]MBQ8680586.1 putative DNA binding domain-containing protein [Treponema sp.]